MRLWRRAAADRPVAGAADAASTGSASPTAATRSAGTLAHGEKRKLEIALLLAGEPDACCCSTSRWPGSAPRTCRSWSR